MNSDVKNLFRARAALESARTEYKEARIKAQISCKHSNVLEGDADIGNYITSPPFRVCTDCGYAEEGWGCGYSFLEKDEEIPLVNREKAFKHVQGGIIDNEDYTDVRLGRKDLRTVLSS